MSEICPFCGCDPFHYVHNGLGLEAVAVTCCDLGVEYFNRDPDREIAEEEAKQLSTNTEVTG